MPTTVDELAAHFEALDLKYGRSDRDEHALLTSFTTQHYRDPDGDDTLRIVVLVEHDGRFLKAFTPMAYKVPPGPHREAVFMVLLHVSWRTKMVQFEYDPEDGEVRAIVEFPVEDSTVTKQQFKSVIMGMVQILEHYHPIIQAAIDDGTVAFPEADDSSRAQARRELLRIASEGDPEAALAALKAAGLGAPAEDGPSEL